jgi:hypothetical protein
MVTIVAVCTNQGLRQKYLRQRLTICKIIEPQQGRRSFLYEMSFDIDDLMRIDKQKGIIS